MARAGQRWREESSVDLRRFLQFCTPKATLSQSGAGPRSFRSTVAKHTPTHPTARQNERAPPHRYDATKRHLRRRRVLTSRQADQRVNEKSRPPAARRLSASGAVEDELQLVFCRPALGKRGHSALPRRQCQHNGDRADVSPPPPRHPIPPRRLKSAGTCLCRPPPVTRGTHTQSHSVQASMRTSRRVKSAHQSPATPGTTRSGGTAMRTPPPPPPHTRTHPSTKGRMHGIHGAAIHPQPLQMIVPQPGMTPEAADTQRGLARFQRIESDGVVVRRHHHPSGNPWPCIRTGGLFWRRLQMTLGG